MHDAFRRLLVLIFVFTFAFLAVFAVRNWQSGNGGLLGIFRPAPVDRSHTPESYTLREKPIIDLDEVEVLNAFDRELAELTEAVIPSVVSIDTTAIKTQRLLDNFGRSYLRRQPQRGIGSGVIVSTEGHVLTNYHVIADKNSIRVTLADQSSHIALLVGHDAALDIAVLRLQGDGPFPALAFGDSDQVRVGQLVFAVGNPFGLGETVTQGIISAKERALSEQQRDLFQIDAAINPGSSGGPLINTRGEIIGINSAIWSVNESRPAFQGLGFSIPANEARRTMRSILERGVPVRGFLGVVTGELNDRDRRILQYDGTGSVAIAGVTPGSPAEMAGLQLYDVILSFDGREITGSSQFINLVRRATPDESVQLRVWRKGKEFVLTPVLADAAAIAAEEPEAAQTPELPEPIEVLNSIGLAARDLTLQEAAQGVRGVLVTQVANRSKAFELGIRAGDLIVGINQTSVQNLHDFYGRLVSSVSVQQTDLHLMREDAYIRVSLPRLQTTPPQ